VRLRTWGLIPGREKDSNFTILVFGAHATGGYQGYLTGSETSGKKNLSPISTGYRIGRSVFPGF